MNEHRFTSPELYTLAFRAVDRLLALSTRFWMTGAENYTVTVYPVPRGGYGALPFIMNALLTRRPNLRVVLTDDLTAADLIIDDLIDSGKTRDRIRALCTEGTIFLPLIDKSDPSSPYHGKWLTFPWEMGTKGDTSAEDIVVRLLQFIGEDPTREGLRDTPQRFLKAWKEWASGYGIEPNDVLTATFEDGAQDTDEMVIVHNIPAVSKCEHHLADIIGFAHVGYVPNGKIIGLSKIPRVVDLFSRRLQVQERLTTQIAAALDERLEPLGTAVLITASHGCMATRGVKIHGSVTTTSKMTGVFRENAETRHEFLSRCEAAERLR